jgi:hypothetical protein
MSKVTCAKAAALRNTLASTSVTSTAMPARLPTFSATAAKRSPNLRRMTRPNATGTSSTSSVLMTSAYGMVMALDAKPRAYRYRLTGIMTMPMTLDAAVIDRLRAVSARDRCANRLLVVPPGQVPMTMSPMAASSGKRNRCASPKAMSGIQPNCESVPMRKALGRLNTSRKRSGVRDVPMPNMSTMRRTPMSEVSSGLSTRADYHARDGAAISRTGWPSTA